MGRGALEHLLQGGGKPFETQGGEKPSEVNYQRELKNIIPTHRFATMQVKHTYSGRWKILQGELPEKTRALCNNSTLE
jgi:hypothetical protein